MTRLHWLAIACLIATRLWMFHSIPMACDDAFITFRYSQNLALGHGAVYNLGERIMGYSSPLWMVLMSLPHLVGWDPQAFSRYLSLCCDLGTVSILLPILGEAGPPFAFAFALWPFWSALSASGLEMSCALFLLTLAVTRLSWWSIALLFLVRPEGSLMALFLLLWTKTRDRVLMACTVIPALLTLWAYYGSPIPHSITAKLDSYGHPGPLHSSQWWVWLFSLPYGQPNVERATLYPFSILLTAGLMSLPLALKFCSRRTRLLIVTTAIVWLCYIAVGTAYFWWYMTFPLFSATLVFAVSLPKISRGWVIPTALAISVAACWPSYLKPYKSRAHYEAQMAEISQAIPKDPASVLCEAVGIIGYLTHFHVYDMVGIVSPAEKRTGPWLSKTVQKSQPTWIILRRDELAVTQTDRDSALSHYRRAASLDKIDVFHRVP